MNLSKALKKSFSNDDSLSAEGAGAVFEESTINYLSRHLILQSPNRNKVLLLYEWHDDSSKCFSSKVQGKEPRDRKWQLYIN